MQSQCAIDHLVVAAATLDAGAEYVRATLGVEPEVGGTHERMGTHNRLLKLGEALYLEVIAIDPSAAPLSRARWFGLDRLAPDDPPQLLTWVVRTHDIDGSVARSGVVLGPVETMTRGNLSWRITVPAEGSLPSDGVMPSLIQWNVEQHPADRLRDSGCSLVRLEARHVAADRIEQALRAIDFAGPVTVNAAALGQPASLIAIIETAAGYRTLCSVRN
ncbi:MAG: hypothetical protein JWN13_2750 [Betaproteobacteria bacterium]|nr:hypothetical protein [Betaproteobacteria bacterium]